MMVTTVRSEFRRPFSGSPQATEIALGRLAADDLSELLGALTEGRLFPPGLRDPIIDRSDGIPLFLEEQVKTIYETMPQSGGAISADQGRDIESSALPTALGRRRP